MSSVFIDATVALNEIISGRSRFDREERHSVALQKLYIRYIRLTSPIKENLVLGPKAFFIYLVQKSNNNPPYTVDNLEEKIRELVRDAQILDLRPTDPRDIKHLRMLKTFSSL